MAQEQGQEAPGHGASDSSAADGADEPGKRIKIRETTKSDSWTIPEPGNCPKSGRDRRAEFFHEEQWEELHIVHAESKQLLARYTRAQVFGMASRPGRKLRKTRAGTIVSIHNVDRRTVQ